MADKKVNRQLSIFINDKEVVNSLTGITRAVNTTTNQLRNLNATSDTYDRDLAELTARLAQLTEQQTAFREELQLNNAEMGAAKNAFSKIFDGIKSGDFTMVKEGLTGVKQGVKDTWKAFTELLATPVGAFVAVLVGFGLAAKELYEYNEEMTKLNNRLSALGVVGKDIAIVRSEILATAQTYNKEFNELAEGTNSFAKSFGISMSEANNIIAEGLAQAGSENEDFLNQLSEYDVMFAKAGYSAEEFVRIVNKGFELGVYTDKLPDALKEMGLSLEEITTASRDALVNAFGAAFTDDLLVRIKYGTTSTTDALKEIAVQANKVGLNAQQAQQLTADLFRGAGEDAGGAMLVLKAVGEATKKELSEASKATEELRKSNEALNKTTAELFEIEGYGNVWTKVKVLGVDAINVLLKSTMNFINSMVTIPKVIANGFISIYNNAVELAVKLTAATAPVLDALGVNVDKLQKKIQNLKGTEIKITPVFNIDADKEVTDAVVTEEEKRTENLKIEIEKRIKALTQQKERLEALGKDTYNVQRQILLEQQKLQKKGSEEYIKITNQLLKLQTDRNKKLKDARTKDDAAEAKAAKDAIDRAKAIAKSTLDLYVANHQTRINKDRALTQAAVEEEVLRLKGIRDASIQELAIATGSNELIIAIKRKQGVELNAMDMAYLSGKKKLEADTDKAIAALKTEYLKQEFDNNKKRTDSQKAHNERMLALAQETDDENIRRLFSNADYLAEFELEEQRNRDIAKLEAAREADEADLERQREYELQKAEIAGASETELQAIRAEFDRQKVESNARAQEEITATNKKYEQAQQKTGVAMLDYFIALKNQEVKWSEMSEASKLALTKQGLSMAAEMFNKGSGAWKALKMAEVAIATAQGAINAYQSLSGIPIVGPALGAIAAGVVVAYGAKQLSTISKTKMEKQPKFFFGGYTGNTAVGNDEYGKVTGVVHDGEYVIPKSMMQEPEVARTAEWLEAKRTGAIGGSGSGSATAPPPPAAVASTPSGNGELLVTMQAILFRLDNPIAPNLIVGYKEVEDINKMNNEITASGNYGQLNN